MDEINDSFLNLLLPYQLPHLQQLSNAIDKNQVILDASDTGTGKTYTSNALIKLKGYEALILSPKSVISNWISVAKIFNINLLGVSNYEAIKSQKMYDIHMNYISCPYINKIIDSELLLDYVSDTESNNNSEKTKQSSKDKQKDNFEFIIPEEKKTKMIIIFDEAHRCKNAKSSTSKVLVSAYKSGVKMMLLSATISDKIECFKPFGHIFGYYDKLNTYNIWMRRQLMVFKVVHDKTNYDENQKKIDIIHKRVFPNKGSRMKISLLGDLFPQNQIMCQSYYLANHEEIDRLYLEMNQAISDLKVKELRAQALGRIIRCRQRIEILKVPIFLELAEDALENGYNIAIFVNYHETLEHIAFQLDADCFIHGKQGLEERNQCIADFQANKSRIIIAIIQAGGVGVSLHDLHGIPRLSLISPTWSGQDLVQCLGRIHRAGAKTPAQQKIVFCADTYEERICEIIQKKITNIMGINDNDLNGPNFDQEYIELIEEENKKDKVATLDSVKEPIKKSSREKVKDKLQTKTVKKRSVKTIDVNSTDEHVVEL